MSGLCSFYGVNNIPLIWRDHTLPTLPLFKSQKASCLGTLGPPVPRMTCASPQLPPPGLAAPWTPSLHPEPPTMAASSVSCCSLLPVSCCSLLPGCLLLPLGWPPLLPPHHPLQTAAPSQTPLTTCVFPGASLLGSATHKTESGPQSPVLLKPHLPLPLCHRRDPSPGILTPLPRVLTCLRALHPGLSHPPKLPLSP